MAETAKHAIDLMPSRHFFIFGNNISHSLSPTIHNAGFAEFGLPYHYAIYQTPQIDEAIRRLLRQPDFGGASVTFPHKLNIRPLLDSVSKEANALGAINTVVVENVGSSRNLRGDNTDWLGILNCIRRSGLRSNTGAIVIGAGGAARAAVYALQVLGVQYVTIVNRTRATAERLAGDFPSMNIQVCDWLIEAPTVDLIIGCIPADDVRVNDVPEQIFSTGSGVVIEMSYRPPVSALMQVASRQAGWQVFGGVDILKEQAYAQFKLWTGRDAPVEVIERTLEEKMRSKS